MDYPECENYLDGFCLKDIDSARIWDCTCFSQATRAHGSYIRSQTRYPDIIECPYPKIGKDEKTSS